MGGGFGNHAPKEADLAKPHWHGVGLSRTRPHDVDRDALNDQVFGVDWG